MHVNGYHQLRKFIFFSLISYFLFTVFILIDLHRGTYIIRELVENYANQPQYVKDVDWYFMPLVNPDGYEFAHTDVGFLKVDSLLTFSTI